MTRDHNHPIVGFYTVVAVVLAIATATLLGCSGLVTEGYASGGATTSSTSPETTIAPGTTTGQTSTGTTAGQDSEASGDQSTAAAEGSEGSPETSTGDPEASTSTAGSDGGSSTGGPVSCETADDCEPGQVCNPTLGYICETPYDDHHCDETCLEEDRVSYTAPGLTGCYCARPCILETDCGAEEFCNSLIDRCILNCANGPDTCPQWAEPTMVCALVDDTPPYVQMCIYTNEP